MIDGSMKIQTPERGKAAISSADYVFMCCYARVSELELKRWDKGVFRPLDGKEQEEYEGLQIWWQDLGSENQMILRARMVASSKAVSACANSPVVIQQARSLDAVAAEAKAEQTIVDAVMDEQITEASVKSE
jgi:hypothetical protein